MEIREFFSGLIKGSRTDLHDASPIVIGGTGGSGTRVVPDLLTTAEVFLGVRLNKAFDAQKFEPFLDDVINETLARTRTLNYTLESLPDALRVGALGRLDGISRGFVADRPEGAVAWGWKNPRSMYILPFIHSLFPAMRFVHVIRDGRDIAFSENQNQPRKHYEALFGQPLGQQPAMGSVRMWEKVNLDVDSWGRSNLGERYIAVRFEDLCAAPLSATKDLFARLVLPTGEVEKAAQLVAGSSSIGRWTKQDRELIQRVTDAGRQGLKAFGYL